MIGRTLGPYRVLEKLGQGGMGVVWLAEDTRLRRRVALKVLLPDVARDPERIARFVREARAAAAVAHPNIAAIHDVGEADGCTFIAMEYIQGRSLRQALGTGPLAPREALRLATQIAEGLSRAHESGIVHRDLKPDNVILSGDGYAKIVDFGLAKLTEPLAPPGGDASVLETELQARTREGAIVGTVAYMSPEQARGSAVDARSDIFSFGILLYEMSTGRNPFSRNSVIQTLSAILEHDPPPPETLRDETPPAIRRILRKTLQKDITGRYQNTRDLVNDLREAAEAVAPRPPSRRRRGLWAAAFVLALAGLGIAVAVRPPGRTETPRAIGASGRPAIAVMRFDNPSGDADLQWLSQGLTSMLLTGLAQTPGLDIVGDQRIHEVLGRIGPPGAPAMDKSLVTRVAREAGAGAVVAGSVMRAGGETRIDIQVEDVGTGHVLFAGTVRGTDVFALVDDLSERIRNGLNLRMSSAPGIADVTSESIEAYRLYSEGLEAHRNKRTLDAIRLFEKATELDPGFALAWYGLARSLGYRGASGRGEYLARALEHADRLPERQRLLLEAAAAKERGSPLLALEILDKLLASYPDEEEGYLEMAALRGTEAGRTRDLGEVFRRGVTAVPRSGPLRNGYGYDLMREGRYEEALQQFEEYARLQPREPNPFDSQGEVYLRLGKPGDAIALYERALAVDPSFLGSLSGLGWAHAMTGRLEKAEEMGARITEILAASGLSYTATDFMNSFIALMMGRHGAARDLMRHAVESEREGGDAANLAKLHLLGCLISLAESDGPGAVAQAQEALGILQGLAPDQETRRHEVLAHLLGAAGSLRTEQLGAARQQLAAARSVHDPNDTRNNWWFHALEGEIALAAGDEDAAAAAFLEGKPRTRYFNASDPMGTVLANELPMRDGMARVLVARGDDQSAIEEYRRLLTPGAETAWISWMNPRYVLALARLLDRTGDENSALGEYRRFLDLWERADRGLPEIEEARGRVSALSAPVTTAS